MATLLEIAAKLGDITSKKAPKRTGNLQRKIKQANTGRNVLGGLNSAQAEKQIIEDLKSKKVTFTFQIDYAPDGAEYGMWWNSPTVSRTVKGRPEVNFAKQAIQSPEFQQQLNEYNQKLIEKITKNVGDAVAKELSGLK